MKIWQIAKLEFFVQNTDFGFSKESWFSDHNWISTEQFNKVTYPHFQHRNDDFRVIHIYIESANFEYI